MITKTASKILYHGSPDRHEVLHPRNSHGDEKVGNGIFATPNKGFALAYIGGKWSDATINQGMHSGAPYLTEMAPGQFDKVFGARTGYLHKLRKGGFLPIPGRSTKIELLSNRAETPYDIEEVPDIMRALREAGYTLNTYDNSSEPYTSAVQRMAKRYTTLSDKARYSKWVKSENPQLHRDISKYLKRREDTQTTS